MRRILLSLACFIYAFNNYAQTAPHKYWIEFTDKANNPYDLSRPEEFLSERAIKRRIKQSIPFDHLDIPVTPMYIDSLKNMGLQVLTHSKWLNGATIYTTDTSLLNQLPHISFIKNIKKTYYDTLVNLSVVRKQADTTPINTVQAEAMDYYGYGYSQIAVHNGHLLHNLGYKGKGVVIAVVDAGFYAVNRLTAFDSIWQNGRVLGTRDFVTGGVIQFNAATHGTGVLSTIAANVPGTFVGTAPEASLWLIRSEDARTEYIIEEDNWVAAAEFADSVGVDIINTSLGYSTFDDASQNHQYLDMDGNTTRVSRGAKIAARKGMLIVCSAGNQGNKNWRYITAPADADSILTVGAVDTAGNYAPFSSIGPTADGRIKPNIVSVGYQTYVLTTTGNFMPGNGTSYASPIVAGLAACLWQANPGASNIGLLAAIERASNQYFDPNYLIGYGIPDFFAADTILKRIFLNTDNYPSSVGPNPFSNYLTVNVPNKNDIEYKIDIIDTLGRKHLTHTAKPDFFNDIHISGLGHLGSGVYIVDIIAPDFHQQMKVIKK